MNDAIIFGAGKIGKLAANILKYEKNIKVTYFIDNDCNLWGQKILDIPVISLDTYRKINIKGHIWICAGYYSRIQIGNQLKEAGITDFSVFEESYIYNKERLLSWSDINDCEDVILYHVLKDVQEVFWIDVGCNDPDICSVTKFFYERGGHGINIDIKEEMIELCKKYRPNDINLQLAVGKQSGESIFYEQGPSGALSTLVKENVNDLVVQEKKVNIVTLREIEERYVKDKEIHFLKIDVEGMEEDVLLGADFSNYRPKIVLIESTLPCTKIPCFEKWENILIDSKYHYVYSHGINRYYVANECDYLDGRFIPWDQLVIQYYIHHVSKLYY